ncbi:MAG: hypothetical protein K0R41_1799 [Geminicoccaceae bacterium]|nr:hypothetical protein [Geminicoccaceae bacterium]
MLRFGSGPEGAAVSAPQVYSAPLPGALLAMLGISALVLLALMPATFGVGWLPFALIGLPLAVGGACGVLMGYAVLSTRIEVARDGLVIAAPGLRACPFPPVRQYRLEWAEVRAVRHRTEVYRLGPLPLRLPLEAYAVETADGFIPFGRSTSLIAPIVPGARTARSGLASCARSCSAPHPGPPSTSVRPPDQKVTIA